MDMLRVRVYNVRFGDAILISVPDASPDGPAELRHILIDVGNSLATEGGLDAVFETVMKDVLEELGGHPLDLYIMTHEHLDHVQGLLYAQRKVFYDRPLKDILQVRHAWLSASADPQYGDKHPKARKRMLNSREWLEATCRFLEAAPEEETDWVRGLMMINNPRATADCVDLIRGLAPGNTHYVHRGVELTNRHLFHEAKIEIWAPEEDTSIYYGRFQPAVFGVILGTEARKPALGWPVPPAGVDVGVFYQLVERRRWGYGDNLLAIDAAANNTSVVFSLTWRGWRLLFPGDAELRSWQEMDKRDLLQPVHFLKVSHHGSYTGTPPHNLLEKLLPVDGTPRYAVVSGYPDLKKVDSGEQNWTYQHVPEQEVLKELKRRADLRQTVEVPDGGYIDYAFGGDGHSVTVATSH